MQTRLITIQAKTRIEARFLSVTALNVGAKNRFQTCYAILYALTVMMYRSKISSSVPSGDALCGQANKY